ncbi:ComF family protein [Carboxydothermus pertinax]|uniref:Competence protein n=1 Tax=Carboxydothermus pertinax TaxID=870242 RepID=A0A1L8CV98_9THEO|nr:ComF family protein [Carboxydothermus pertinax]GAV22833.1 competence protein [Carboxydothermus pertinax]
MLLDFLYPKPKVCPLCLKPMPKREFCQPCREFLNKARPVCQVCGRFLPTDYGICSDCRKKNFSFIKASGLLPYTGPVRQTMVFFKYKNKRYVWDELYDLLAWHCREKLGTKFDFVVPVPLHPRKFKERGYNQAEILAKNLAHRLQLPVKSNFLVKVRETPAQVQLGFKQRRKNLRESFYVTGRVTGREKVLLVDDVFTTGATAEECTHSLLLAGIAEVYVLTMATAVKK